MIRKNKTRLLIILVFVLLILLIIYLDNRVWDDNKSFALKKDLKVTVYSNKKVSDFIKNIDGKIINDNKINTNSLGNKKISFIYLNKRGKKRRGTFTIKVIDDVKPIIWLSSIYYVKKGSSDTIKSSIMAADNYDKNLSRKIVGTYDLNTIGSYKLTYVATDKSGNESKKDFTLKVYEPVKSASKINTNIDGISFNDIVK